MNSSKHINTDITLSSAIFVHFTLIHKSLIWTCKRLHLQVLHCATLCKALISTIEENTEEKSLELH